MTLTRTNTDAAAYRSDERGSARGSAAGGARWTSHPVATALLRASAVVGPLVAAVAVTIVARTLVPVPAAIGARLVWGLVVSALATSTLFVVAVGLRRVLPLAALLRLSLAFPDQAPSRFRIARRTATVHQAQARVAAALVVDDGTVDAADPATAIRRCLELVGSLAHHDRITRGHCERVRAYCSLIGEQLGLGRDDLQRLQWAGLLHDVGKVGVPARVLNKRGRLTALEWDEIQQHPGIGARLTKPLEPWLGDWVRGVGEHHERWDGGGYPAGLRGDEISVAARIIAVADAFDVMTAARSYKDPLPAEAARAELVRCAGSQFDDVVVRAFVAVSIGRLRRVMGPSAVLAQVPVLGPLILTPTLGAAAPFASAAVVIGGLAGPAVLAEKLPPAPAVVATTPASGAVTRDGGAGGSGAREATSSTTTRPDPPTATPPRDPSAPAAPTTTTTTRPAGPLDPVVDPVTDDVIDPLVDTVDELVPGLGVDDTVEDLRCLLPLLGCP